MTATQPTSEIAIRRWSAGDLPLLQRLMGDPAMTEYLGGPESPEKIRDRHERYCHIGDGDKGHMFVIEVGAERIAAGSIGYWEREWQGQTVWETGWSVLPEFQGQGIGSRAIGQLISHIRTVGSHRYLHAYPAIDNAPSNAICRKAGFTLQGKADFEYPPGHWMEGNDWRYDLQEAASPPF